jgi:uncharacterized protein (UPF0210 family)
MSRKTQTLALQVPKNYTLPLFYESASPQDVAEALTIGSALYTTVKTASTETKIKEIEDAKEKEITTIQEETKQKIKTITESLHKTEEYLQIARLERTQQIQNLEKSIQELTQAAQTAAQ